MITDKPDSALAFYEAVLGLTHTTVEMAPGQTYHMLQVGTMDVGGCMEPPMREVPNHWHVYFAADDADATAAKAAPEGGRLPWSRSTFHRWDDPRFWQTRRVPFSAC